MSIEFIKMLLIFLIITVATNFVSGTDTVSFDKGLAQEWENYKYFYKKTYTPQEDEKRFSYYKFNRSNLYNNTDMVQWPIFSAMGDWTKDEIDALLMIDLDPSSYNRWHSLIRNHAHFRDAQLKVFSNTTVPDRWSWVTQRGIVTSVKDQGPDCKSSYVFAALGVLEGLLGRGLRILPQFKSNTTSLSAQYLMDCSLHYEPCIGGYPYELIDSIGKFFSITKDEDYPYLGHSNSDCKQGNLKNIAAGAMNLPVDEELLKSALYHYGPIAVTVRMSYRHLITNAEYVDNSCMASKLYHSMLLVGYGTDIFGDHNVDYWLLKNSLGAVKPFVKIARNAKNMCEIASFAQILVVYE